KQELKSGENKSLTTDRVVLAPGTPKEIKTIRWIYTQFIKGQEIADITRDLNLRRVPWQDGKPWNLYAVRQILTNLKYAGWATWALTTQKLHSKVRPNPPEQRVLRPH